MSANVEPGATVITDAWQSYRGLEKKGYIHDHRSQRALARVAKTRARCCQACIASRPWQNAGCSAPTRARWTPRTCRATSTSLCSVSTADAHVAAGCCSTESWSSPSPMTPCATRISRGRKAHTKRPKPPGKRGHPPSLQRSRQNRPWRWHNSG